MDALFDSGGFLNGAGVRVGFKYSGRKLHGPDDVAIHFGLKPLGSGWVAVSHEEAREILPCMLRYQFAGSVRLTPDGADRLSAWFIARCSPGAQFFTNWQWHDRADFD